MLLNCTFALPRHTQIKTLFNADLLGHLVEDGGDELFFTAKQELEVVMIGAGIFQQEFPGAAPPECA